MSRNRNKKISEKNFDSFLYIYIAWKVYKNLIILLFFKLKETERKSR